MVSETSEGQRKVRADVLRNRGALLDAAQRHFRRNGVGSSLEAVAKEAGVGPATLYRHFPTREALLAALLYTRKDELQARRTQIAAVADPVDALQQWMRAMEDYFSAFSGLPDPLMNAAGAQDPSNPLLVPCEEAEAITEEFLTAAKQAGGVRSSVTAEELLHAAIAVAWTMGFGAENAINRLRGLIEHGYRQTPD